MSNRSFMDRATEERSQCLVVGRVILPGTRLVGGLELIEHGTQDRVGIGGLALPLRRVEIVHISLVGLFIVAEQTHRTFSQRLFCLTRLPAKISPRNLRKLDCDANRYPLRSKTLCYSTTFGTRKKWLSVAGAFLTISSAISPSLTTSARFFISIGITDVIGSTPSTLTSDNCSTNASIAFSSPCKCGTSASVTAIRARWAIRRTVSASTDIIYGSSSRKSACRIADAPFAPQPPLNQQAGSTAPAHSLPAPGSARQRAF